MKFYNRATLFSTTFIIALALVIVQFSAVATANPRKDVAQAESGIDSVIKNITKIISGIPGIGSFVTPALSALSTTINKFEKDTNGTLTRLLDDILPCTITENGISCEGWIKTGGLFAIFNDVLSHFPDTYIPKEIKSMVKMGADLFASRVLRAIQ